MTNTIQAVSSTPGGGMHTSPLTRVDVRRRGNYNINGFFSSNPGASVPPLSGPNTDAAGMQPPPRPDPHPCTKGPGLLNRQPRAATGGFRSRLDLTGQGAGLPLTTFPSRHTPQPQAAGRVLFYGGK